MFSQMNEDTERTPPILTFRSLITDEFVYTSASANPFSEDETTMKRVFIVCLLFASTAIAQDKPRIYIEANETSEPAPIS